MNRPRIRTGIHLNAPGAPYPASLRLSIGDTARQLDVSNARGIADRIHDLRDRIDVLNGDAHPPRTGGHPMIQDEHTVDLTYGTWKKQRGILIQTKQGRVFVPAFCPPDIRRRLACMQDKLEHLPEPNRNNT